MEYTTVFVVWAVAVTGPCVISWLAGDMAGASRTRQLFAENGAGTDQTDSASALRVEAWRVPGVVHPLPPVEPRDRLDAPNVPSFEEQAAEAERRHERRQALAARAPLMRDGQAHDLRAGSPDAPAMAEAHATVQRYERSALAMHQSYGQPRMKEGSRFEPEDDFGPGAHAPLTVSIRAPHRSSHRLSHRLSHRDREWSHE